MTVKGYITMGDLYRARRDIGCRAKKLFMVLKTYNIISGQNMLKYS